MLQGLKGKQQTHFVALGKCNKLWEEEGFLKRQMQTIKYYKFLKITYLK